MTIYDLFFLGFSLIYLPYLFIKGKAHEDFAQRFGCLPEEFKNIGDKRPLWVHAVSVGEVLAAKPFIDRMAQALKEKAIVLSTTTRTGHELAEKIFGEKIKKFYFPLDLTPVIKKVLKTLEPCAVVIMETEIWPNLILGLYNSGTPAIVVNGRLSERSFGGYKNIKSFFKNILNKVSLFCMQSDKDKERIVAIGAPGNKVKVTGNMKFDISTGKEPDKAVLRNKIGIKDSEMLIIAGSTHPGEEELFLRVYQAILPHFKGIRLLIAPRHIERAESVKRLCGNMGLENVIVLDTIGELAELFSIATIVIMGGSFVKKGGHNLIEPAVFAKAIVFGKYMHNFRNMAASFLEEGAAIQVSGEEELAAAVKKLLSDETERNKIGRKAYSVIHSSSGASERNVEEVLRIIGGNP